MARRDIIVMGGSAGSIRALEEVVGDLPANLAAAIFVVVHLRGREKSLLAEVLNNASPLTAVQAEEGLKIEQGRIYVAPPDRHMLLAEGHLHLSRGPKEGLHRPSINATFRSAAGAYRERVIGVLFSGMLDDGAAGLWEIAQNHGLTIVQDPREAEYPSMPLNALADVPVNYQTTTNKMGELLVRLTAQEELHEGQTFTVNDISPDRFSGFTCPECRGPLYETSIKPQEFRCRVGHIFSVQSLLEQGANTQERKMYEAIISLEEGADMAEVAAQQPGAKSNEHLWAEVRQLREHAKALRQFIEERQTPD